MKKIKVNTIIASLIIIFCFNYNLKAQNSVNTNHRLSQKQQSIIPIASYTAKGDLMSLQEALNDGLNAGLSVNKIKEILVHTYAYCGFPRSIRGLQTFMSVLQDRRSRGINDEIGPESSPITDNRDKYERGREILENLTNTKQDAPSRGYTAFAPVIDTFLKEHLFTDIFERDLLSYQERELATISVLSSIGGAEPMMQGHFNICLNIGFTPEQLQQFISILASNVEVKEIKSTQSVLDEILKNRKQQ